MATETAATLAVRTLLPWLTTHSRQIDDGTFPWRRVADGPSLTVLLGDRLMQNRMFQVIVVGGIALVGHACSGTVSVADSGTTGSGGARASGAGGAGGSSSSVGFGGFPSETLTMTGVTASVASSTSGGFGGFPLEGPQQLPDAGNDAFVDASDATDASFPPFEAP
jgi:hypothetical protein